MSPEEIGSMLFQRRRHLGLTQREVVSKVDKDASWISRLERGVATELLSPEDIAALEDALQYEPGSLEKIILQAYGYLQRREMVGVAHTMPAPGLTGIEKLSPESLEAVQQMVDAFNRVANSSR